MEVVPEPITMSDRIKAFLEGPCGTSILKTLNLSK